MSRGSLMNQLFRTKNVTAEDINKGDLKRCLNAFDLTLLGVGAIIAHVTVPVSSHAAPIKPVIKLSRRWNRNTNVMCVQCRGTSHEQQVNCFHRTTVRRALSLPNWQPDPLLYPKHLG